MKLSRGRTRAIRTLATLACLALASIVHARSDWNEVDPPLRVSFRLIDSSDRPSGELVAWNERLLRIETTDTQNPTEREWLWRELEPRDSYNLRRRLIDRDDAEGWLDIGMLMLETEAWELADRALKMAVRLDGSLESVAEDAKARAASGQDPRLAIKAKEEAEKRTEEKIRRKEAANESGGTTARDTSKAITTLRPWPQLDEKQLEIETERVRTMAQSLLRRADMTELKEVQTEHFILFSDLSPTETRQWGGKLDQMYHTLVEILDLPADIRLFHGKCVIFIFNTQERYIEFEQLAFGYNAEGTGGLFHPRGPNTFVSFFKGHDHARFNFVLIHETVHAFMYRYKTPAPLPTWANEGLADFIAGHLVSNSAEPGNHFAHVKKFIRDGGDPREIMAQTYANGTWFNEDSYPVSHMLVHFMVEHTRRGPKAGAFKRWIDDIKGGKDWKQSLEDQFGVSTEELARGFIAEIESEAHYERIR